MIRALLSPGPARHFFKLAPLLHQFIFHQEQFQELRTVAARPRLNIASDAVDELINRIQRYGQTAEITDLDARQDCRDPNDNYLLAIALAGPAEFILTEDEDLLVLSPWKSIRIMRLFQFLHEYPLPGSSDLG